MHKRLRRTREKLSVITQEPIKSSHKFSPVPEIYIGRKLLCDILLDFLISLSLPAKCAVGLREGRSILGQLGQGRHVTKGSIRIRALSVSVQPSLWRRSV